MQTQKHLDLLGFRAKDKITGIEGIVTSISFDLYGCIQIILRYAKDNEEKSHGWIDISRVEIISEERIMDLPDYEKGYIAEGKKGPAQKPLN